MSTIKYLLQRILCYASVGGGKNDGLIVSHRVGIKVIKLLNRNKLFQFKIYKNFVLFVFLPSFTKGQIPDCISS